MMGSGGWTSKLLSLKFSIVPSTPPFVQLSQAGWIESTESGGMDDWQDPTSKFEREMTKIRLNAKLALEDFGDAK